MSLPFFLLRQGSHARKVVASSRGLHETLLELEAGVLLPKLLSDIAASVDKDISHKAARVLLARHDVVPGSTRIRDSIRVRECFRITQGITENEDLLTCLERVDEREFRACSAPSMHAARNVAPNSTCMMSHRFVILLFLPNERDALKIETRYGVS